MCKEHLGVAHALKVPAFFVITKVDICPEHILKQSLTQLSTLLKRPGVRKRPFLVKSVEVRCLFIEQFATYCPDLVKSVEVRFLVILLPHVRPLC